MACGGDSDDGKRNGANGPKGGGSAACLNLTEDGKRKNCSEPITSLETRFCGTGENEDTQELRPNGCPKDGVLGMCKANESLDRDVYYYEGAGNIEGHRDGCETRGAVWVD